MTGHHLILGELTDFITGETLPDTLDERLRQEIARLLVEQKHYLKSDIEARKKLVVKAGTSKAIVSIDFLVWLADRICMIVKFAPGSLVTRQRPVLAASRLLAPYQIPFAVVTNGRDAEVLDAASGKVRSRGLETIPSKPALMQATAGRRFERLTARRREMESRIVYCYEVDGSCPCDENVCRL